MPEIVIGVADSPEGARALDRALVEGQLAGEAVEVVRTWAAPTYLSGGGLSVIVPLPASDFAEAALDLAETALEKAQTLQHSAVSTAAHASTREGAPGRAIVEASRDAALIVLGGRGRGYVASTLLGSTTAYVLHHAPCPVMIVPAVGSPASSFDRVLVAFDGSACSHVALRWGLAEARRHGCPLVAVHVLSFPLLPGHRPVYSDDTMAAFIEQARMDLALEIAEVIPEHEGTRLETEVVCGRPAEELMQAAGADDLLVLGTRGHGGFTGLLLGSVATQCAQHSGSTVAVIRESQPANPTT